MSVILLIITLAGILSGVSVLIVLMRRRDSFYRDFLKRRDRTS